MPNTEYLKLVTSQHYDKPKFIAWLTANLEILDDADDIIKSIDTAFDIDSAVGNQLDVLGQLLGVSRYLTFQPSVDSPTLDDDTYRFVLKARIVQNQWDGTLPGLYQIWNLLFPLAPISVKDNQDMTCDITFVSQNFSALQRELLSNGYIIPNSQCVDFSFSFGGTFSFRTGVIDDPYTAETDNLAGFSDISQVDGGYFGSVTT